MGCISSKGMSRSMSIHERFSQGIHALAIGSLPGDDFRMTSCERERFVTLIKIASGKQLRGFRYVEADTNETTSCNEKPCMEQQDAGSADVVSASCRRFHTLEELDELIEKINLFEARIVETAEVETRDSSETSTLSDNDEMISKDSLLQLQDNKPENTGIINASGWKRRAMARELQSLMLPISEIAELSAVGSLKEWIHSGDDIYSPESYVTPKFGSYVTKPKDFSAFSPELVAAFEECMLELEAEELAIVKQMEERNAST